MNETPVAPRRAIINILRNNKEENILHPVGAFTLLSLRQTHVSYLIMNEIHQNMTREAKEKI